MLSDIIEHLYELWFAVLLPVLQLDILELLVRHVGGKLVVRQDFVSLAILLDIEAMDLKLLRKGDPPSFNARRLPAGRGLLLWPPFNEDTAISKGLDDFVTWDESFSY